MRKSLLRKIKDAKKAPVLVLGMGPTALAVIRDLGRRGIPVIGVDSYWWMIGFYSKYCNKLALLDPEKNENELFKVLLDYGEALERKSVLFAIDDNFIAFLSKYAHRLRSYYRFPLTAEDYERKFLNKRNFYQLCKQRGISFPITYFPNSLEEVKDISQKVPFPCIIKPVYSHIWAKRFKVTKAIKINSPKELLHTYKKISLSLSNTELMIQEVIGGGDDRIYLCAIYLDSSGEPLSVFTGRTIRQYPPDFGTKCLAEGFKDNYIAKLSIEILRKIGFCGICGVEFKKDPKDGQLKIMEVNPRVVRWYGLTEACGVPVIYTAYKDLIGEKQPKWKSSKWVQKHKKWISFWRDIASSLLYICRDQLSFRDWIGSLKGRKELMFGLDDISLFLYFPFYVTFKTITSLIERLKYKIFVES